MSSQRGIFLVMFFVLFLNESQACFLSTVHENTSRTTGSSYYKECQCDVDGYTVDNLRWLDSNDVPIELSIEPLRPGTTMFTEKQGDSLNLHIPSITKTMSGTYKCVTQVNGKTHTQSYTILAYDPLYFYETPTDQNLVYGRTSWITCQPKSDSIVKIDWQKENEKDDPIDISNNKKYSVEQENHRLVIHNVTENDAGTYKCTAQVIATNEEADKYITVKVLTEPEIIRLKAKPSNNDPTTVVAGMNLTIECIADGMPHPDYFWNKTSEVGAIESDILWRQEINTIIFDQIRPEDSGVYTCHAFNLAGTSEMNISVEVLVPPYVTNFPNITDVEGATVQIICNATGKSEPSIFITYEGGDINDASNELIDFEPMPNMHVMILDRSKEGVYLCNASNEVGSVEAPMYLSVLHRPYFNTQDESIWGWVGKATNFNCDHDSNPPATISWRFHSDNKLTDEEVEINKKLLLTLNSMPEPYFTITIDNETAFGIYECTATNTFGEAIKRITLVEGFRPGSVNNVSTDDPTATSVTFHIEGPDHVDGPEVIGFTATYDEENNYNITDIHINRTWAIGRPFKLDKLKPNTTYLVRFAALNEVGPGTWSDFIKFTTLDKSVPEPPVWDEEPLTVPRKSPILKWRAPDDNGEPIDYYTLRYCSEEDEESCKTKRLSPTTELLELIDLKPNTTYFLELVAHNAEGDSLAANVSVVVPAPLLDSPSIQLSGGAIIGVSIVIAVLCLLLLDVLLLVWRRQGIIATCCCYKKDNKRKESPLNSRDKKGLLTSGESEERTGSVRDNGHKEFQYNKNTGVVTGKHSAV